MADPTISGTFPESGDQFQFNVNGLATQKQLERLIQLTEAMAKRIKADIDTGKKQNKEDKEHYENTKDLNEQQKEQIKKNKEVKDAWDDLIGITKKLKYGWKDSAKELGGWTTEVSFATSFLVGSLTGYADSISGAMKMGVSGDIMDFGIAAKTAGVSMSTLTKALADTGGGFASLGQGATDGAKNFAALVSSVRAATAGVGNLGMSNEDMAMFTAQQTKLAVSQGFKGRAAQDVVIKNSQYLGKELDDLANRTGKNVLAMAEAAAKLASDPIVTTFVKTAQAGSKEVSTAIQSFGASLNAQFGDMGSQLGADALKSALGGLPFAITQTGKNMLLASQTTYAELERQAQKAKRGEEITAEDRKTLNDTVLQEVAARGDQLRMMANLEGPAGESARQLLSMAKEAEFYNSEAGRQRREQDKTAQQFNASIRQLQANLQALAVPFLNLINGINWTLFIDIISGATKALEILLSPLIMLGKIIGDSGVGTVIGGILGFVGVLAFAKTGLDILSKIFKTTAGTLSTFKNSLESVIKSTFAENGTGLPGTNKPTGAVIKDGGKVVNQTLEKFAGTIKFATAAIAGLALSTWGASRLQEDENDTLGKFLVGIGSATEVVGTWGSLFTALFPELASKAGMLIAAFSETIGLTGLLTKTWSGIVAMGGTLMTSFRAFALATMINAQTMGSVIAGFAATAWTAISGFASAAMAVMAPFLPFIAIGAAIVGVGYLIYKNWDSIVQAGKDLWEWLSSAATKIWDAITSPFTMLKDWFKNSWLGKMFGSSDTTSARGNIGSYDKAISPIYQGALGNNPGAILTSRADNSTPAVLVDRNTSGYTKELTNTQSNAIDQNKLKDSESANIQRKQLALLEDISSTNNAQLGVQSRTAGNQDNSTRYLKTISMNGPAA
jgi:hypothetical protein